MKTIFSRVCWLLLGLTWVTGAEDTPKQLVVHEWGTFTGIAGSDGVPLYFYPISKDLPKFVISRSDDAIKDTIYSTVSLETPVTYFYAREAMQVNVKAEFPSGQFTEWYPAAAWASRDGSYFITWADVKVLPGKESSLPGNGETGRYFHAREAGANLLRVKVQDAVQYEKFLFYRGAGNTPLPLKATISEDGRLSMENMKDEIIPAYVAVTISEKKVRFVSGNALQIRTAATADFNNSKEGVEPLAEALVTALVEQGLFEKEARAMVATWRDAWLEEEGTRVLYLLPTKACQALLPLTIKPKPDDLVRVMVGRQDLFTRTQEQRFKQLFVEQAHGSPEVREKVMNEFNKLGRFGRAAFKRAEDLSKSR